MASQYTIGQSPKVNVQSTPGNMYTKVRTYLLPIAFCFLLIALSACSHKKEDPHALHKTTTATNADVYTCPMHPEIIRDKPGKCPICGMALVKKETGGLRSGEVDLDVLLRPTNEFVLSSIPVTTIKMNEEQMEITALGNVAYDTRDVGSIASRVAGRIEKLYIRYRYQKISKGQHILDIYSPELLTAQQNLLFLLKNDAGNATFIQAAKDKLLLLGMSAAQLQQVIREGKPALSIAVYSNYNGHVHESINGPGMNPEAGGMKDISQLTEELSLKEGMYLQKGQSFFKVYNPDRAWVVLNIFGEGQALVKKANAVMITPETAPGKSFRATINFIEPFYRKESKTLTARVYFNNSALKIPIGSQVRATIYGNTKEAWWLPNTAVVSLGMDKVVFQKTGSGFKARKINAGIVHKNHIQVLGGITSLDSVAVNAEYLMDSESFIKVND
jgi:Cu(I)/Ag(I) efflux system membrane fusion protein